MSDRWYVCIKAEPCVTIRRYLCWDKETHRDDEHSQYVTKNNIAYANSFATKSEAAAWRRTLPPMKWDTVLVRRYSRTARIKAALDAAGIPEFEGERSLTLGRRVEMMGDDLMQLRKAVVEHTDLRGWL